MKVLVSNERKRKGARLDVLAIEIPCELTRMKLLKRFFSLVYIVILTGSGLSTVQADDLVYEFLEDGAAVSVYPGADGLIGTGDDQFSTQSTPMNGSDSNVNGSYSYIAYDFGTGLTDAPFLPTGFNAINFISGTVTIDLDAFSTGGMLISDLNYTSTEPFSGHGPSSARIVKQNSVTYNDISGAFSINIDFTAELIGGTANVFDFDLTGEAWFVDSVDFSTFDSNSYVSDVLIPKAKTAGASKLLYINGSGTVPAASGGLFPRMPIKGVIVAFYKAGKWLVNDFDGNKRTDLPWRNQENGQNRLWLMNGPVREVAGSIPAISTDWIAAGTGDFNKDQKVDIFWRNTISGINRIWFMEGLTRTGFSRTLRMKDTRWQVGAICDLNNDGNADIVWRHGELPRTRAWIMDGPMQIDRGALPQILNVWLIAACADFDGDGNDDLLWRHISNGQNRIWLMQGTIRKDSGSINIASSNFRVGGAADFTNDGKADIVFHDDLTGRSLLWSMDGLSRLSGKALKLQNPALTGVAIGDWGGDRKLDIFWRDLSSGRNQIWNMDGATRMSIDGVVSMPTGFFAIPE